MSAEHDINITEALFCDLKTDAEKAAFFLSGRGYETGVIALAIQNDVAMAYHRCAEYAAIQPEQPMQALTDELRGMADIWLINADECGDGSEADAFRVCANDLGRAIEARVKGNV